jgi:hypothetical protein
MRLPRPFKLVGTRLFPPWFDRLTTSGNIKKHERKPRNDRKEKVVGTRLKPRVYMFQGRGEGEKNLLFTITININKLTIIHTHTEEVQPAAESSRCHGDGRFPADLLPVGPGAPGTPVIGAIEHIEVDAPPVYALAEQRELVIEDGCGYGNIGCLAARYREEAGPLTVGVIGGEVHAVVMAAPAEYI